MKSSCVPHCRLPSIVKRPDRGENKWLEAGRFLPGSCEEEE